MTSSASPRVGVVLLNWNRWADTIECMESLFRLDYGPVNVIVCDQGSTDGSVDRIREWAAGRFVPELNPNPRLAHLSSPPVAKPIPLVEYSRAQVEAGAAIGVSHPLVLIQNGSNLGSAAGNNIGLRFIYTQPSVKYAWILNNDIVVAPDALLELVRCAESDDQIGAVGGRLLDYTDPDLLQVAGGGKYYSWRGFPTATRRVVTRSHSDGRMSADLDWVTGGNMLSPVAALRRIGEIDAAYFLYMEDIDHSLRLRNAGLRFGYASKSLAWHKGGATVGYSSPRYDYYMVRNALAVARKHHPRMMPFVLGYTLYRVVLPKLVRGQWSRLGTVVRAYKDFRRGVFGPVDI